jgi:hypothetical protein
MSRLAVLIAVEQYSDSRVLPVQYAEDDAKGFAAALELGGQLDKLYLLSAQATKTSIQSKIRQHVRVLTKNDELFLFYAGHGFSVNGSNFLTCHDTDQDDLEDTSIELKSLLDLCANSACTRIAFFLDSCESGITDLPDIRGIYSTMSEGELSDFFKAAQYRACFASCRPSESSYSVPALKHGVWSYLLIQALEGNDPLALERNRYVTAASLQNYLTKEVPRLLRKHFVRPAPQTPLLYSSQTSDFVISDLKAEMQRRQAVQPGYEQVKQVFMHQEWSAKIASLSGFMKRKHRVPEGSSDATRAFVARISEQETKEEIEQVFQRIIGKMKYKRRDITADAEHIATPDFEFWVECTQDTSDPGMAVFSRQLTNISPTIIGDGPFNAVFEDSFSQLTFQPKKTLDLQAIIDQIEDLNPDHIKLDYPSDCSHCDISVDGLPHHIRLTPGSVTVSTDRALAPKLLLVSFFDVQRQLVGSPITKAIEGK